MLHVTKATNKKSEYGTFRRAYTHKYAIEIIPIAIYPFFIIAFMLAIYIYIYMPSPSIRASRHWGRNLFVEPGLYSYDTIHKTQQQDTALVRRVDKSNDLILRPFVGSGTASKFGQIWITSTLYDVMATRDRSCMRPA